MSRPEPQLAVPEDLAARSHDAEPMTLSVFGATGSIGTSTLDLVERAPDRYRLVAVTAQSSVDKLIEIALKFRPERAVIADDAHYQTLADALAGTGIEAVAGRAALIEAATMPADMVMAGITGAAGLEPALRAVQGGGRIGLANKECLVCAGSLFMAEVARAGARVLPVDSEHNAVFQVFDRENVGRIEKVILTASGGPFRTWTREEMEKARPAQALKHPNWSMGAKITIDSATLMNKGLEIIEAFHLFPLEAHQFEALIHPQSAIHGLVQYEDGSLLAQLGAPDMRTPIAHCLSWPERGTAPSARLDLAALATLTFEKPDFDRFPAFALALAALKRGEGAPTVLNAANEIAVHAFLEERIGFLDIAGTVEAALDAAEKRGLLEEPGSLRAALELDSETRALTRHIMAA
ncbi:1-deoxy-D-xylulose-5-phosphate reductoisomerase [Rhodobium gokarnense]|uniref:1-deoxy-D-xylulose 5-phosphate reductoisomerase n=1 Tax=Rhodobium gokarnense TaxID=364296 RepID=A0ABT3HB64_9HYPH|nr:1-deoxy-D-xylulose-5-phosphate reductoisomerase [Rhodobium gokarnense]MCW2307609.1 1-deoxy-D-xylulose-5-phosphate reductoisomerase [Rhodobium gokarnense]